ncbi:N-6 DNA methylase [Mesorhizobium sp. M4B.F.Ca.ET.172.01.1.1]|uniref:N-6 DNA methylase n=1 Tax=unclassified Mesorhizobium TaxID=325217 RepID=UPI0032AFC84C
MRFGGYVCPFWGFRSLAPTAPEKELSIYGIEKVSETLRLAKMNLAVHGLGGTIMDVNGYYDEPLVDRASSTRTCRATR